MLALLFGAYILARHFDWGTGEWDAVERQFSVCGQGSSPACVVDGDTLRIGDRRIRLTGFDAPEMDGACDAERRLARVARDELAAWLNLGRFEMDGGTNPPRDDYGRELRAIRRGGEALADTMAERGLARRSGSARDWCA
ncbi:thermonuclease family protein [Aurantiacibacter zhengii]|uniref:Thermonuclease family protein n=1 Tax=Aurantiacibacter zhengii TaxID=2307003 RepID=A0A418NP90_9SPHN|nr:thermonuclease family protein [Aurantiacibacter zhengii]RIV83922.1 thermonuclease family protein [Aurantiacibacter zhengii]